MAKNYIQKGDNLKVTAKGAQKAGEPVIVGALKGIALNDAAVGEVIDFTRVGVFDLPKKAADNIGIGDPVSWDFGTALASSSRLACGVNRHRECACRKRLSSRSFGQNGMALPFHKAHYARAVKAARDLDLTIERTIVRPDGSIELVHGQSAVEDEAPSPFDKWKNGRA